MSGRPNPHAGLHHIALHAQHFEACEKFYVDLLGMQVMWRPDENNLYLTSGNDNLALHRTPHQDFPKQQHLDHLGFFLKEKSDVDDWHKFLLDQQVLIVAPPKDHRDGTRSFYCQDPDGNVIQMIYYPFCK